MRPLARVIDQKQISDLPLNGRSVLQLATLCRRAYLRRNFANTGTPGQFGTRSLYITVDGGRASSTNYVSRWRVCPLFYGFKTYSPCSPSVDTIQEFQSAAEQLLPPNTGRGQAAVSMVTKSGSKSNPRKARFEYTRSSIFDARNYFSTYAQYPHKPVFHRNQFGGTIGAPIVKDKNLYLLPGTRGSGARSPSLKWATFPPLHS